MLDQVNTCDKENMIHQLVKVQAQVKVIPLVKHGKPKVNCLSSCLKPHSDCSDDDDFDCECDCECESDCNFTLTQIICVEIPICFDADVEITKGILCCGRPEIDHECRHDYRDDLNYQIFCLINNKMNF